MKEILLASDERWKVIVKDEGFWAVGLYRPENESLEDVKELEKHDCPELFVLLEGDITLVLSEGKGLKELKIEKGKAYLVTEWHNAYGKGLALVVERDGVKTEFKRKEEF